MRRLLAIVLGLVVLVMIPENGVAGISLEPGAAARPMEPGAKLLPQTDAGDQIIRIGRTYSNSCVVPMLSDPIPVQEMLFSDYVRNVLPNEWIASWPSASLDAGAVAVKQYAWYTAFEARKWSGRGYPFDLLDNPCDQQFKDNSAHPATDAALARTWPAMLLRDDGRLMPIYYRARDSQCMGVPNCMGQWGTYDLARCGLSGAEILMRYFSSATIHPPGSMPGTEPAPAETAAPADNETLPFHRYLPFVARC